MNKPPSPRDELRTFAREVRVYLEALQTWGVQNIPLAAAPPNTAGPPSSHAPQPQASTQTPASPSARTASPTEGAMLLPLEREEDRLQQSSLSELESIAKQCTACRLHQGRTHVVFGVGNPKAELMFVGEAPGRDEDLQGEPFVGRAGQLLTRIIEAMGLKRRDVYIANVIKCRPPNNRNPQEDEIARCEPYLIRQVELIKPRVLVALGTYAAQTLLKTNLPISQLRGRFHSYHGSKLMPTFHPAFLLRNPERKRDVWEDMQIVQREISDANR